MFNGNVRVRPGSNRWPQDLQSYALPLSYAPNAMFLYELVTMYLVLILNAFSTDSQCILADLLQLTVH